MSLERIAAALIAAMLLATAVVGVRRSQRRLATPVDVLSVFMVVWGGALLLFAVPVLHYAPTPITAWLAIDGSIAATAAGCLLASRRAQPRPPPSDEQVRSLGATIDAHRLRLLWLGAVVLGLIGFAAFVYAVDRAAGWRAVFDAPAVVRDVKRESVEFQTTYGLWKLLTYCNQIAFVLWTIGLRMRAFGGRWRALALFGWASLIPFVFTADRNLMAAALALAATVHLLWPWRGPWRRVTIVFAVGVAIAAVGLTAIGNRYGSALDDQPDVAAHVTWPVLNAVAIPYLYLTANIPTFGQLTEDGLAPLTAGQMTMLPAVKTARRAGLIDTVPVETGVFYPIPFETFSNYSWLGVFWLDFRWPGVLLAPLLVAFVATRARLGLLARASFLRLWTAAILLYVIAYSPLSNVLYVSLTWEYLLLGPLMAAFLQPGLARQALAWVGARARLAAALASVALTAAAGLAYVALTRTPTTPERSPMAELRDALAKARYVYTRNGRYPGPHPLATRLGVNRPEVSFRGLSAYTDPLPPPGVIAVFTRPHDVVLRIRGANGRVYEVHRSEEAGGATFGSGARER